MGVVVGEKVLYPPAVDGWVEDLFDAPPQVGSGSAVQRAVPQPQGQGGREAERGGQIVLGGGGVLLCRPARCYCTSVLSP